MKISFAIRGVDRQPGGEWECTWVAVSTDSGREISTERAFVAEVVSVHELLFSWLVVAFGFFNTRTCELESDSFCRIPLNRFMHSTAGTHRYAILSRRYADIAFANSLGDFESVGEMALEFRVRERTLRPAAPPESAPQWGNLAETSLGKLHDMLCASYKIKDFLLPDIVYFHSGYMHLSKCFEKMLGRPNARDAAGSRHPLAGTLCTAPLEVSLATQGTPYCTGHVYRVEACNFYRYYQRMFYFAIAPYGKEIAVADVADRRPCAACSADSSTENVVRLLGIPPQDILEISTASTRGKCSFIVFLYRRYLVVSFRGTISPKDVHEDFRYEYVRIGEGYTHLGIKDLAEGFVQDRGRHICELMDVHGRESLLLTGHSLGGSVAIVVGYTMLGQGLIANKRLKVVGVSAVPVFSEHIVQNWPYRNFRTLAVDFDIVPFLSIGSFLDFRYICCCIGYGLKNGCMAPDTCSEVQKLQDFLLRKDLHMKLYLPGSIVHLRSFERKSPDALDKLWSHLKLRSGGIWNLTLIGAKKYDYTFSRLICFSKNIVSPHFPGVIQNVFETAIRACKEVESARNSVGMCIDSHAAKKSVFL